MSIVVSDLEKRFGPIRALRGVRLEIPRGQCVALLGPNGAGKSTLLRIIAGLMRPTLGHVSVHGDGDTPIDPSGEGRAQPGARVRAAGERATRERRSNIGYLGHESRLYGDLSARENLIFAGRLYDLPDPAQRADTLLEEEGLADAGDRSVRGFSRGMVQRLAIARALVHEPRTLLLDEPFTGLDPASSERLAARIESLGVQGCTRLLVTHDLTRAAQLADSAVVLVQGKVGATAHGSLTAEALGQALREAAGAPQ